LQTRTGRDRFPGPAFGATEEVMKALSYPAAALILAALTIPAAAAALGPSPTPSLGHFVPHAVNPSLSLSAPAMSPLEQQMQDNYAVQLQQAQRQLLQQNPSGVSRPEIGIGHQLNSFMGPR
jgi:hypothetical protein